ncbi:siderophore-interacting protein [Actinophytocola sediminis]
MTERRGRRAKLAQVLRVEQLTPHLRRVVLGGPGLAEFTAGEFTDHYIKMLFPVAGAERPTMRTYTVRAWDADSGELTVDVVLHGDVGLAGPWALRAAPGDEIEFMGPGGEYAPSPEADWHLFAGDESALPAIAASLERLPTGARAHAFIEVAGPDEELKLESPGEVTVTWLHRGDERVGVALVRAVADFAFPEGSVQAFVHGEAGFVKELRRLLLIDREVPRDRVSISGYWRVDHDEDRWQATKRDWNRQVEEEQDS